MSEVFSQRRAQDEGVTDWFRSKIGAPEQPAQPAADPAPQTSSGTGPFAPRPSVAQRVKSKVKNAAGKIGQFAQTVSAEDQPEGDYDEKSLTAALQAAGVKDDAMEDIVGSLTGKSKSKAAKEPNAQRPASSATPQMGAVFKGTHDIAMEDEPDTAAPAKAQTEPQKAKVP